MILVTGATGNVGSPLVKELGAARARFRALLRDEKKGGAVRAAGGEVAVGDLADRKAVAAALAGVEKLFLLTPPSPDIARLEARVAKEARKAGVRHIVKLSAWGTGHPNPATFMAWHRESEKAVEKTGVAYTHLRPNAFMQNFLMFADSIQKEGAFYAPAGDACTSTVDARDIAAVAARTLTEEGHAGRVYDISGPAAITYTEAAETIGRVIGRPVRFVNVPDEAARKAMISGGMPDWFADALVGLYVFFRQGNGARVTDVVQKVARRPARSFEQFVKDNARAFGGMIA